MGAYGGRGKRVGDDRPRGYPADEGHEIGDGRAEQGRVGKMVGGYGQYVRKTLTNNFPHGTHAPGPPGVPRHRRRACRQLRQAPPPPPSFFHPARPACRLLPVPGTAAHAHAATIRVCSAPRAPPSHSLTDS